MEDFGSPLPFNYVYERTSDCWCAYYCRLNDGQLNAEKTAGAEQPEMWGYFLWRPRDESEPLEAPDLWGYVDEIPYEHLFIEVRGDPIYLSYEVEADLAHIADSLCQMTGMPYIARCWFPWIYSARHGGHTSGK